MGVLISISGCSASGKSTFAKALTEKLSAKKIRLINSDVYFKNTKPTMISPYSKKVYEDFNSPETLDIKSMLSDIERLLKENDIVIAEGVLIFCFEELRAKSDLLIYIDTNIEVRLSRRLIRNTKSYGMNFDDVLDYYNEAARFSEQMHTGPSKMFADIIINGEKDFTKSVDIVSKYILSL